MKAKNTNESDCTSEMSKSSLRRRVWNQEEDKLLDECVKEQTSKFTKKNSQPRINWKVISDKFSEYCLKGKLPHKRTGKQCRERWRNHLTIPNPQEWKLEDRLKLFEFNYLYSNKWAKICKLMGRTENDVKNQYHVSYRKKITEVLKELNSESTFQKVYQKAISKQVKYNDINTSLVKKLLEELEPDQTIIKPKADQIKQEESTITKNSNSPAKFSLQNKIIIQTAQEQKIDLISAKLSTQQLRLNYTNDNEASDSEEESYFFISKFENFCNQNHKNNKVRFNDY